eukprot:6208581-Pleurochrysis_carterae.AAC.2
MQEGQHAPVPRRNDMCARMRTRACARERAPVRAAAAGRHTLGRKEKKEDVVTWACSHRGRVSAAARRRRPPSCPSERRRACCRRRRPSARRRPPPATTEASSDREMEAVKRAWLVTILFVLDEGIEAVLTEPERSAGKRAERRESGNGGGKAGGWSAGRGGGGKGVRSRGCCGLVEGCGAHGREGVNKWKARQGCRARPCECDLRLPCRRRLTWTRKSTEQRATQGTDETYASSKLMSGHVLAHKPWCARCTLGVLRYTDCNSCVRPARQATAMVTGGDE